ncbi:allene oxide synthase-lipoxygenase protein-like isoform X2 [Mytilus galloprovincialis]|uniref:allene oxide synthase-lipoxygenase protein-like isoform X2 n=1 Tax=Mytilus galloprovincialis TaxID=29158 RepID=UPI003F7C21DF
MSKSKSKGTDAKYNITVQTGDKKGAGTHAHVNIILYGTDGIQTKECKLSNFLKGDFKRGKFESFSIKSEVHISEVRKIELWRDNNGSCTNWYLDWIEVTKCNKENSITTVFPALKWIKENYHYFFVNETTLPQNDPMKVSRKREMQVLQKEYQLDVKIPGLPAQVKVLPEDETFSWHYFLDVLLSKLAEYGIESHKLTKKGKGKEWKNVDDVKTVYTKAFGVPQSSKYFNDDMKFGRQRISCLNSLLIEMCTAIPENFAVTENMIKPFLEGKTIKQAIKDKRLFMTNLAILEDCPTRTENLMMTCPLALFYFNDAKRLMPIAIQLFQTKGLSNPVFLPSDPEYTWMLAKLWYNLADSTYHQALTHLNFTHLMMEGISVSTKRQLALQHPIMKLLNPHFLYLMAIDSLALVSLIKPGGIIDKISNAGIEGVFHIMGKSMECWRLDLHGTLPDNLKSRGVFDQSVLTGAYHVRDDGLLLYDAIKSYVEKYVLLYYSSESSLAADYELQNWGAELVKSRDDGGVGILGVPGNGNFKTTDQLVITVTAIIYTCSAGHATANFEQYDEYGAPFNYPYHLSGKPPTDKSPVALEAILNAIAKREMLIETMSITNILSDKATDSLGHFEKQFIVDPHAVQIVE